MNGLESSDDETNELPVIDVGSTVCIRNRDVKRSLTLENCYIGEVTRLFKLKNTWYSVVKLYLRPKLFPCRVNTKGFDVDKSKEVVEDFRECRSCFKIKDIFSTCQIVIGHPEQTVEDILKDSGNPQTEPVFALRYKLEEITGAGYYLKPITKIGVKPMAGNKNDVLSEKIQNTLIERGRTKNVEGVKKISSVSRDDQELEVLEEVKENTRNVSPCKSNWNLSHRIADLTKKKDHIVSKKVTVSLAQMRFSLGNSSTPSENSKKNKQISTKNNKQLTQHERTCEENKEMDSSVKATWICKLDPAKTVDEEGGPIRLNLKRIPLSKESSAPTNGIQIKTSTDKNDVNLQMSHKTVNASIIEDSDTESGEVSSTISSSVHETVSESDSCKEGRSKSRRSSLAPGKSTSLRNTVRRESLRPKKIISYDESWKSPTGTEQFSAQEKRSTSTPKKSIASEAERNTEALSDTSSTFSFRERRSLRNRKLLSPQESSKSPKPSSKSVSSLKVKDKTPSKKCAISNIQDSNVTVRGSRKRPSVCERGSDASHKQSRNSSSKKELQSSRLSSSEDYTSEESEDDSSSYQNSSPERTPKRTRRACKTPTTPRTPKSKSGFTPSMPRRASAPQTPTTNLEQIRKNLHVSAVPKSLPCREMEYGNIYNFVENKIRDEAGGCMYISGVPGTGKTATVHAVIRSLQEQVSKGKLKRFKYIEVNGLRMTEPRQVFVQVLRNLTGQKCTPQQARDVLAQRFCSGSAKNETVVLLVDEVDMLRNKRQDVIYNLFDWPSKSYSRLIVLTIANTMDLPERLLKGRVTSRLGLTRLVFQPYSYKQLHQIVMSRLQGSNSFNDDAVELVARKVAAYSGDVRRALDICRRASELVEEGNPVTMPVVNQVISQMMNSANVCSIRACSKLEKVFLEAVVAENERTGVEETTFISVYRQFQSLCAFSGISLVNISEAMAILSRLATSGLLLTDHSRADINQSIFLNVSTDDIHYSLKQTPGTE